MPLTRLRERPCNFQSQPTEWPPSAGSALTAMGLLSLILSLIYAIIGQIQLIGPSERLVEREKEWVPKA